jgi:hypothetical protein
MTPGTRRRCLTPPADRWYGVPMRSALVLVALAACGPGGRPPSGATPDAAPVHDSAPAVCFDPSVTGTVTAGTANIQTCAIWNSVSKMTGSVTLSRTDSMLTMAFASGPTFAGTISGTSVTLTYAHLHDFEDGCTWRATETLSGTLDPTSCVMTLSYSYVESVSVSNGACATPCTGTADFSLQVTPILQ